MSGHVEIINVKTLLVQQISYTTVSRDVKVGPANRSKDLSGYFSFFSELVNNVCLNTNKTSIYNSPRGEGA